MKLELALALYQRGILAMGPARRLADISKREFLGELGKRKIERHYTVEELEEDVAFAKGSLQLLSAYSSLQSRPAQPFEGLYPGDFSRR